jgi:hypothetical protein
VNKALVLLLVLAAPAGAQRAVVRGTEITRGPVYTTDRVVFELRDMSADKAINMPMRLRIDSATPNGPFVAMPPPHSCVTQTPTTHLCDSPLPQGAVDLLNTPGRRTLYAFAFDGNCCESGPSNAYTIQGRRP